MFNLNVVDALGFVSMRICASRSDREGSCIVLFGVLFKAPIPTTFGRTSEEKVRQ